MRIDRSSSSVGGRVSPREPESRGISPPCSRDVLDGHARVHGEQRHLAGLLVEAERREIGDHADGAAPDHPRAITEMPHAQGEVRSPGPSTNESPANRRGSPNTLCARLDRDLAAFRRNRPRASALVAHRGHIRFKPSKSTPPTTRRRSARPGGRTRTARTSTSPPSNRTRASDGPNDSGSRWGAPDTAPGQQAQLGDTMRFARYGAISAYQQQARPSAAPAGRCGHRGDHHLRSRQR